MGAVASCVAIAGSAGAIQGFYLPGFSSCSGDGLNAFVSVPIKKFKFREEKEAAEAEKQEREEHSVAVFDRND